MTNKVFNLAICLVLLLSTFSQTNAQIKVPVLDSVTLEIIKIIHADSGISFKNKNENYHRLLGAVSIEHNGYSLTCDSAHFYLENNFVEAFSNVHISKPNGLNASGNYIKYVGNTNTAYLQGNALIIEGTNSISAEDISYNLVNKIGKYEHGGSIENEGTNISSQIGTYNGNTQQTYFKKDVVITNPKYSIQSEELKYNIQTKVVQFLDESTIISENNNIQTKAGTYNSKTGEANFTSKTTVENEDQFIEGDKIKYFEKQGKAIATGHVTVIDSKENTQLTSNYVEYNKSTGLGKAVGHVVIIDSKNMNQITANKVDFNNKTGYGKATGNVEVLDYENDSRILSDIAEYNKQTGYGKATGHVYIENEGGKNYLTSKETEYNKKTGYAKATGHVVFIDTVEHSKLLAGMVQYNDKSKFMLATDQPKLITLADNDSLFMRADTMLSVKANELTKLKKVKETSKKGILTWSYNLLNVDSSYQHVEADSQKIIIANHNVKLFSDSLQAVCDSLHYSQIDSSFRLFRNPILWSSNQQSNADTIFIHTKNNKLSELNLINNSLLVSETGFKGYYDQVSGAFINAYFTNNEIQKVYVNQNAESLYYAKDEQNKYLGNNKAESSSMDIYFINKEVDKIVMHENPKGLFSPIDKLTDSQKFLAAFKLLTEKKPKSKAEILED